MLLSQPVLFNPFCMCYMLRHNASFVGEVFITTVDKKVWHAPLHCLASDVLNNILHLCKHLIIQSTITIRSTIKVSQMLNLTF